MIPTQPTISTSSLQELVAKLKAKKLARAGQAAHELEAAEAKAHSAKIIADKATDTLEPELDSDSDSETTDRYGKSITYNERQNEFISAASTGENVILIGAAGTGKTTCMKGTVQALILNCRAGLLSAEGHKHLDSDSPGIVVCAYTRRAVANIRKNMPLDMQSNCITIHKLLEYQPVYYETTDNKTGESVTKMKFEPTRNQFNPLPASIRTIIFEESSMIGTDLYLEVLNACPHRPQEIFLGDIQQLPPVFGPAILGFKLLEYKSVELTEVYRQALESPIIQLAHRILSANPIIPTLIPNPLVGTKGEPPDLATFPEWKVPNQLTIHPWKKKISDDDALNTAGLFFYAAFDKGGYDPEEDMILLPFNEKFGTLELNKKIANYLARKFNRDTFQIIAGFNRVHFSIGDKVLFDKEDATIINIETNPAYSGANPTSHSTTLDYWGFESDKSKLSGGTTGEPMSDEALDFLLAQTQIADSSDRVRQCSHILTLRMNDSDTEIKVQKASDVNAMLLGYALTVHKSQGSEWRKVFFIAHQSHATMLQRELLYTAVTRAKEELYIICERDTFDKGIRSQRVKGNTLAEKAEHFKGKLTEGFDLYRSMNK